ncbi:MAG: hypothetical protein CMN55_12180 [Sneathiella sp.]|uniref:DnaJ domain-containing protein n=1 Tax=Sneathiella sp. TaxID=1964365 RepID=UPI000C68C266|nr:DnaJ domain-containing protein [Sneathiella sp.]MAL79848.1 hypothetical protein [Sneathiella sp.]
MLAYFIIGIFLFLALIVGSQALANADPGKILKGLRISAVVVSAVLAGFFILTGRFPLAPPFIVAALFFLRNKPLFSSRKPSDGQTSDVHTLWLAANLDHDSGEMDATILQGAFEGLKLSSLSRSEIDALYREAKDDARTIAILESFISRKYGEDFSDAEAEDDKDNRNSQRAGANGGMTRTEALAILELTETASIADIKAAHRRLMKKFHPDHNGSDYMAAKLNEAKDFLLKG